MESHNNFRNQNHIPKFVIQLSRWLDTRFVIPGTKYQFGLDPIIGLIPGLGDVFTLLVSGSLISIMANRGVSGKVVVLMALNVMVDAVFGSIPVLGGIFDFYYRANERNIRILEKYFSENKYQGSGKGIVWIIVIVMFLLIIGILWLTWQLIEYIFNSISTG